MSKAIYKKCYAQLPDGKINIRFFKEAGYYRERHPSRQCLLRHTVGFTHDQRSVVAVVAVVV